MKSLILILTFCFLTSTGFGQSRHPYYGGEHHTGSHGGNYVGGYGSHHRGGHYVNFKTGNPCGRHKRK